MATSHYATLSGLNGSFVNLPQGSRYASTLGYLTQALRANETLQTLKKTTYKMDDLYITGCMIWIMARVKT